jgi:hypothetical protein
MEGDRSWSNNKVIPLVLAVIYAVYVIQALSTNGMMDFDNLESVMGLFTEMQCWRAIHYLAFDLVVGMWMVDTDKTRIHPLVMGSLFIRDIYVWSLGFTFFWDYQNK